jgi:hypothetical protein
MAPAQVGDFTQCSVLLETFRSASNNGGENVLISY